VKYRNLGSVSVIFAALLWSLDGLLRTQLYADANNLFLHDLVLDSCRRHGQKTALVDASVEIEHHTMPPEHNDVFLLCCDGLSDLVDDWMIREIMTSGDALEIVAENLIRAANNNGGTDNITVVLAQTFVDPLWAPAHAYAPQMQRY